MYNPVIVFEGMDGAGKNTQAKLLAEKLNAQLASFPNYRTLTGQLVKDYLTKIGQSDSTSLIHVKKDSITYTLDRVLWMRQSNINRELPIVFDRYYTSNILYQTLDLTKDDAIDYIDWLEELEINQFELPKPTKVFVLVVDEKTSAENIKKRGRETDFFESLDKQKKIRDNAYWLSSYLGWIIIKCDDGNGNMRTVEDIHDEVMSHL